MRYLSKAYTYISFSGKNFDFDSFSAIAKINPTHTGQNKLDEKYWQFKIEADNANIGIEKALKELLFIFNPNLEDIILFSLQKDLYVKVFVVIHYLNDENGGVFLDKKFISFLNALGGEFEIDYYY